MPEGHGQPAQQETLTNGRIENPGFVKLEAIAGAMGFPPALWFGPMGDGERVLDEGPSAIFSSCDPPSKRTIGNVPASRDPSPAT
jgi:hypothetical protein